MAITGSNGKTTTARLTHFILEKELEVGLGGNIGDSFALQVLQKDAPNYVLEISSFQLDDCYAFNPKIAIITNITPDHLDRYDYKLENYVASKFRIVQNHTEKDVLIYDADDEILNEYINTHDIKSTLIPFSLVKTFKNGQYAYKRSSFKRKSQH